MADMNRWSDKVGGLGIGKCYSLGGRKTGWMVRVTHEAGAYRVEGMQPSGEQHDDHYLEHTSCCCPWEGTAHVHRVTRVAQ